MGYDYKKNHFKGLADFQVIENRKKFGTNTITSPHKEPLWKLFLEKFKDPIIRILLIAAILSLGIAIVNQINTGESEYAESIGIFCAIFLATGIAFWFEMDANKKFDILNLVNDETLIKVIRSNSVCEVPKKDIVVGDIVILETGDEIPADGELIDSISLQIDESCLTGEPIISKTVNCSDSSGEETYPLNWVMKGTKVMDGHGIFEVKSVGDATEYGKVAQKATEITHEETPLNKQLNILAKYIGVIGLFLATLIFWILFIKDILTATIPYTFNQIWLLTAIIATITFFSVKLWLPLIYDIFILLGKKNIIPKHIIQIGWQKWLLFGFITYILFLIVGYMFGVNPFHSHSWISIHTASHMLKYFMVAVTLVVVSIPEGLPMSVTLSLALSMKRMLKNNNLVRKMHACETMGATTIICTDKTGTLTQNQMQVYETDFYGLNNQILGDDELSLLIKDSISVNSTAFLDLSDIHKIKVLGNPTEGALLIWLYKNNINYLNIRENTETIQQLTFSTERKFMSTLVYSSLLKRKVLYVKGAPEIVLSKCNWIFGTDKNLVNDDIMAIEDQLVDYQNKAMRTLGFAYKYIDMDDETPINELLNGQLSFLGVVAISDPVRAEVPDAVFKCLNAGVDVKIVTGDTSATAKEVARQIGIWNESDNLMNILTGAQFAKMSDGEVLKRIKYLKILCRARPTDKQRLVQLLQKRGAIVAVTGDGTNDAPALNYANVGLSMGSGTSVAKEASDITLLDDSFNSICTAILWGRSIYQNIQRFLLFQLTINLTALIIVFLGTLFNFELPLTVTQMLWVNLIMDTFAAGAFAALPPDTNVMNKKPRRNKDFIISRSMYFNILFTASTFVFLLIGLLFLFKNQEILNSLFSYIDNNDRYSYSLSYFFTFFVMLQFWNMFNAKAFFTNKSALKGLGESMGFVIVALIILIGQFLIVEFGGNVFRTIPLLARDWFIIIALTSLVLWVGELWRWWDNNKK